MIRVRTRKRYHWGYRRVEFIHAHADGKAVLIEDASWRTINGIMVQSRALNRLWIITFRRHAA